MLCEPEQHLAERVAAFVRCFRPESVELAMHRNRRVFVLKLVGLQYPPELAKRPADWEWLADSAVEAGALFAAYDPSSRTLEMELDVPSILPVLVDLVRAAPDRVRLGSAWAGR